MRSYPQDFLNRCAYPFSRPILLLQFLFATGTAYVSDKDVTVQGQAYAGLVRDWGEGLRQSFKKGLFTLSAREMNVLLDNTATVPFSANFASNVAQKTVVNLYLYYPQQADAPQLVETFKIASVKNDVLNSEVRLASPLQMSDQPIGTKLDLTAYPGADPKEVGKPINIIYGIVKDVACLNSIAGGAAILASDILASDTSLTVIVPPNAKPFPASGAFTIKIQYEQIRISAYNSATGVMTVAGGTAGRGYGSTQAVGHDGGRALWQYMATYEYIVASHPVKSIDNVYVRGILVKTGITKTLSPVAKFTIDDDFTLDASVNIDSLSSGLVHGSNYRDINLYGNIGTIGYSLPTLIASVPSSIPNLGNIKAIQVNIEVLGQDPAGNVTDFSIASGISGFTLTESGLTINPGPNSFSFSATDIQPGMDWNTIQVELATGSRINMVTSVQFVVTYDDTNSPNIKSASFGANIGPVTTGGISSIVPSDIETLGDVVAASVQFQVYLPGPTGITDFVCVSDGGMVIPTAATRLNAGTTSMTLSPSTFVGTNTWSSILKALLKAGTSEGLQLLSINFQIYYQDADYFRPGGVEPDGMTSAAIEIGRNVTADVHGQPDDGSGTYTGTDNALIQNPADVIRHFIDNYTPLTPDVTKFTAARAALAAKSYLFAGVINDYPLFSTVLAKMMFQSRSWIWDSLNAIHILMMPDSAPASVRDFVKGDISADIRRVPQIQVIPPTMEDVLNKIGLHYNKVGDKWYGFVPEASDATSIADFGVCERPELYHCDFINDSATAIDLQAYYLGRFAIRSAPAAVMASFLDAIAYERGDCITITDADAAISLDNTQDLIVSGVDLIPLKSPDEKLQNLVSVIVKAEGF